MNNVYDPSAADSSLFSSSSSYQQHRWLADEVITAAPSMSPTTVAENDKGVVVPWSVVWVTLFVSLVLGTCLYIFYLVLRGRHYKNNKYDLYEMRQFGLSHRTAEPWAGYQQKCFGWARAAINTSEQETLRIVGMDAFMFLRFLRLCFRCSLFGTVLGCLVLIPVYATGEAEGNDTEEFNSITLAKVEEGSGRLWASAICWTLFVLFVLRELYREWQQTYAPKRYEFLAHGDVDTEKEYRYAVIVEHVPTRLRSNKALYQYLDKLFPNQIHQVHVCMNTAVLDKLVAKRTSFLNKLEQASAMRRLHPEKLAPTVKEGSNVCGCGGIKTDAITFYEKEIARLNEEVDEERAKLIAEAMGTSVSTVKSSAIAGMFQDISQSIHGVGQSLRNMLVEDDSDADSDDSSDDNAQLNAPPQDDNGASTTVPVQTSTDDTPYISNKMASTAFVTFTSLKAKQGAIQCSIGGKVDYLEVAPAPEPKAIIWDNVTTPASQQRHVATVLGAIWLVGVVFWAIPATFVMGLANLNSLLEAFGSKPLNPDTFWYGVLAGILPVLALQGFMLILCYIINKCAALMIRKKSSPEVDAYTFTWYMLYQFANLWLLLIGGSAFNQLDAMINDPTSIATLMASAVPGASTFFLDMTILKSFVMSMFYLSNLAEFGPRIAKSFFEPRVKTERFIESKKPRELLWGFYLPPIIFIVLVSFVYMAIVPLLELFTAVYFGIYYIVWKHNCLHVYGPTGEGGGKIWERIFHYIMVCLYTAEVIVIAYLGIKKGRNPAIFCFVPLVGTILIHKKLGREVIAPLQNLSLEKAAEVDLKEGELSPIAPADNDEMYAQAVERKLFGQPNLKPSEREPRPYHGTGDSSKSEDIPISATHEKDEEAGEGDEVKEETDEVKNETETGSAANEEDATVLLRSLAFSI